MTYSFATKKGTGVGVTIPVSVDTTGATVTAELSNFRDFRSVTTKTVTATGRQVSLSLSGAEVDALGDGYFRIKLTKDGNTSVVQSGNIDYVAQTVAPSGGVNIEDIVNSPALKAAFGSADVVAPRATGVPSTDSANLQAAIDSTPAGGKLFILNGVYKINQPLVISKHVTIEGQSLSETWRGRAAGGALNRPNEPFVVGAVIEQSGAGQDVIRITGSGVASHLSNLGLTWASGIRHTNTGHGINAATTVVPASGGHDSGLLSFTWTNVVVGGHDGNHYGFYLLNAMYGTLTHLRAYGGGGLFVECDSYEGNFGNLTINHIYNELYNAGTADGIRLAARVAAPAVTGVLNLMTFIRPQVNITGAAATKGTQHLWNSAGGAALPVGIDLISPDFETAGGNPINTGGINSGTILRGGGVMNGNPVGGFDRGPGASYQRFTANGSFRVPNGVTKLRVRAIGGGGGGGGGGSALTTGGIATQAGGGGGGAGMVADAVIDVTPEMTYTITVGAAGTAGTAGAVNGGAGGNGGTGGRSSFQSLVRADGGAGGAGAGANSGTTTGGGIYGRTGSTSTSVDGIPGHGGPGRGSASGLTSTPMPPGVVGGGGGGGANATLGGGRGTASQFDFPAYSGMGGGNIGASADANGLAGQSSVVTAFGCGGGGGGGGAPGGSGGAGGAGAPGLIEVWW